MNYNLSTILKSIVNLMLSIVGVLLGLRFVLKLFGANSTNELVHWIYDMSSEILGPFRNIFPPARLEDGFVIEFSTIFAILVYGIIGLLAFYLIDLLTPATTRKRR